MDVYVVDAPAAIELVRRGNTKGSGDFELFAPTLLRSQVFAILHAELLAENGDGSELLVVAERACRLPHRLLGDAVLRRTAWAIATDHGWSETFDAEYVALTQLHGKALIAGSDRLRQKAAPIVPTETVDSFLAGLGVPR